MTAVMTDLAHEEEQCGFCDDGFIRTWGGKAPRSCHYCGGTGIAQPPKRRDA